MPSASEYIARSHDGRYGVTAPDEFGHRMYSIASPTARKKFAADIATDPELADLIGTDPDCFVGYVTNLENLETAADTADEEARCLMEQARAEFA